MSEELTNRKEARATTEASFDEFPLFSLPSQNFFRQIYITLVVFLGALSLSGCGAGGYVGGGLTGLSNSADTGSGVVSLSSSAITIDAGQSFSLHAATSGELPVSWELSGPACSGAGCGTVVSDGKVGAIYTAPSGITAQMKVTITARISGTSNVRTTNVTINPLASVREVLPTGTVGVAYSTSLAPAGGTGALKLGIASGSLPSGLSLDLATGLITGTPTAPGTSSFTVKVLDSSDIPLTRTFSESITINAVLVPTLSILSGNPHSGTVGVPYSASLSASGGVPPYNFTAFSGALPAGLSLGSTGLISGTPTAQGASTFTAQVQDAAGASASSVFVITINAATSTILLTATSLPGATVGVPYSAIIGVSGGTAPYLCQFTSGVLPSGLSLNGCAVSGTPTVAGTSNLMVKATDSSNPSLTVTGPQSLTISPSPLVLSTSLLPGATVGVPYSATIPVAGGTSPYACQVTLGALPAGLSLNGCVVSGTPTVAGTSNLTINATDSSNPTLTLTGSESITVSPAPLTLSLTGLPGATVGVPYTATIGVAGGIAPYTCQFLAGTLPSGLALNGCVVSGTPTVAGTVNLTVKAIDSSPVIEITQGPISLTVSPAALALSLSTLPGATIAVPYSATIGVTGGTAPYICTLVSGTLPTGLTLTNCTVSGTPLVSGTTNLVVNVTDSGSPVETTQGPVSLTVSPAPLLLNLTSLPNATVGDPYSATIGVTGGTAPYFCTVIGGTLPAGLSVSGCVVSGTPTLAGTVNLIVKAADSSATVETTQGPITLTVLPAAPTLVITSPGAGTVNSPYTGAIGVTGGTAPYTCSLPTGSTLPAGLTLNGCVISGTPTSAGTTSTSIRVTDSSSPVITQTEGVTLVIAPASVTLTLTSPLAATVSTPYTGTIAITGGTGPYTCQLVSGTLPAGLTFANCTISGTPTTIGSSVLTVTATDSATHTNTGSITVTVLGLQTLTLTGTLPNATQSQFYSQTLSATGGLAPYTYTIAAGALPAGLTLSTAGVVSGTPTGIGASSFTVTVTDAQSTPQTASLPLVLLVTYAAGTNDAELAGPYAFLFQGYDNVVAGVLAYKTATVGSFTSDGAGVLSAGELDSNHQNSTPVSATVSTNNFLGTYTVGVDHRGSMTITTLNADGTTATTSTYVISLKAPISPATVATRGDFIQFDNNNLQGGTKGSGTLLAQTTSSFASGLNGSYAFGLQGDTPCLPTCTLGIIAGPVAAVGEFIADALGTISGVGDANIATSNFASAGLSGSSLSADGNGRIQLSMTFAGLPAGVYPADYAVYLVDANNSFVVSTDKHSAYILLAGSTQTRSTTTFNNVLMTGSFVGYENSPTNPGLVGAALQNVLNLSTATLFHGVANGAGTCTTDHVDIGGLAGLLNQLTGLGGLPLLSDLLGTYAATGVNTCAVDSNGRVVLNYPPSGLLGLGTPDPRIAYLSSINEGYFLETGYAGLGNLSLQSGSPFTLATLNGTYLAGTSAASSLASINSSGTFSANGALGTVSTTSDLNVGVGNINLLQLGITGTSTYSLTDASAGRYLLSPSTVIYAISPGRFVLLDTNALTTSPSISLLY